MFEYSWWHIWIFVLIKNNEKIKLVNLKNNCDKFDDRLDEDDNDDDDDTNYNNNNKSNDDDDNDTNGGLIFILIQTFVFTVLSNKRACHCIASVQSWFK